MNNLKFRHEYRHEINLCDAMALISRLKLIAKPDVPNGCDDRIFRVRSLYFDNNEDKVFTDERDGTNYREKFRLRFYGDNTDEIFIERKISAHGMISKFVEPITKEECLSIITGDTEFLAHSKSAVKTQLYSKIRTDGIYPTTIVEYTREAYVYPIGNVKINIDSHLRSGIFETRFLGDDISTAEVLSGIRLLEVKYDEFLPEVIQKIIQLSSRPTESFSKYAACRIYS